MPLEYRIDQKRRMVFAVASGTITLEEFLHTHREVWSRSDVAGFDSIYDLSGVEDFVLSSGQRLRELADLASSLDVKGTTSRLAIVAPQDFAYGIARMYEAYRSLGTSGSKVVSVFRSMRAAKDWLGLDQEVDPGVEPPSRPPARG